MERGYSGVGRPGLLEGWPQGDAYGRTAPGPGPALSGRSAAMGSSFSVRGGPTSIHANLDELERGSVLLAEAAAESTALAVRAAGWGSLMTLAAQQSALAGALGSRTAELSSGLLAVGAEAEVLEQAVGFSVRSYREAEERAQRLVQDIAGVPALVLALGLGWADRPVPVPVADIGVQGAPEALAAVLGVGSGGLATGFWITSDVTGRLARDDGRSGPLTGPERLYPLIATGGIMSGIVQIGPVRVRSVGAPQAHELDGSLIGLMDHLDQAREDVAGPGTVQVTRVSPDAEDAPERVWVVAIPGTQGGDYRDADGWSTNPFDTGGNGEAMALDSQHVAKGIHEALVAAGAQPGDAVVPMGYSQGGIHAARLAADPRLAEAYDMQGLVTVGSPTGEIALDQNIEALHLEHDQDAVTGLDGRGNPQGVNRTTVTFSGYVEGVEPAEPSLLSAHEFGNYRAHVAQLDGQRGAASPDADRLAPAREHLAWLTTGTAVSRTVTLERTRPGRPRNPLTAGLGHQFRSRGEVRTEGATPASGPTPGAGTMSTAGRTASVAPTPAAGSTPSAGPAPRTSPPHEHPRLRSATP